VQVRPRLLLHPGERMDAHDESSGDAGALFDAVLENPHGHEVHATAAGATFVLPPRCRVRVTRSPKRSPTRNPYRHDSHFCSCLSADSLDCPLGNFQGIETDLICPRSLPASISL
jgi:hypothetical protein